MTKVRILVPVAGADFSWQPEQIVEMSEADAAAWADGNRAELAEPQKPPKDEK